MVVLIVALSAAITGIAGYRLIRKPVAAAPATAATTPASMFSFDASAAPSWRQGPTDATSMALFKNDSECFVAVLFTAADQAPETQKTLESLKADGYTITPVGTPAAAFSGPGGKTEYLLSQYSVTGIEGPNAVYKSQEFASVPVSGGFVKVQGYCANPSDLAATVTALNALAFKP